jgi:hypothetical protein
VSQVKPVLNTSAPFGILAAGAITGTTTVTGNVGTSTADAIAGTISAPGYTIYASGNATVVTAHNDFIAAYANALTDNPGGTTLPASFPALNQGNDVAHPLLAGKYIITVPAYITADLYLSGSASDIFIFKTSSTFNTTAGTVVHLGGASRANIYWLVEGAVTLGASSSVLEGTILCNDVITVGATAVVNGALLGNGAITVNAVSVLPVEIVSFTTTANGMNANLRWSTATEVNNYGFDVERRLINSQSSTLNSWAKIGFVKGSGTSNSAHSYSYTDASVSSGTYAYRLKQIDNNGTYKYSSETEVMVSVPKAFALNQNYPNPFNPTTTLQFTLGNDGMTSLQVYNMLGQKVATLFNGNAEAGRMYQVTLDASKLTSGVYLYRLESGSFVSTKKLILMK